MERFCWAAHRPASPAPGSGAATSQVPPHAGPGRSEAGGRPPCSRASPAATSRAPACARNVGGSRRVRGCAAVVQHAPACVHCSATAGRLELASGSRMARRSPEAATAATARHSAIAERRVTACDARRAQQLRARGCSSGCSSPGFRGCRAGSYAQVRTLLDSPEPLSSRLLICGFGVRVPGGARVSDLGLPVPGPS